MYVPAGGEEQQRLRGPGEREDYLAPPLALPFLAKALLREAQGMRLWSNPP